LAEKLDAEAAGDESGRSVGELQTSEIGTQCTHHDDGQKREENG